MDLFLAYWVVPDDLYVCPSYDTVWALVSKEGVRYLDMLDIGTSLDSPETLWRGTDKSKARQSWG